MTVNEAVDSWLVRRLRTLGEKQGEQVSRFARGWKESFGDTEVADVTVAQVEKHEAKRDDGKRSGSALNQERGYCRQFFRWTIQNGWRKEDPTVTWQFRSTAVKREYVELTREQEEKLLAAAEAGPSKAWLPKFIRIAVLTGLREGTIRKLEWGMVREDEILIPASIMKTRVAHSFPLTSRLKAALGEPGPGKVVEGMPAADYVYRAFRAAAWKAGLPSATSPHDLRRTWVARMTEGGTPLQTILALGGWRTLGVLVTHYASRATRKAGLAAMETV